MAIHWYPGHMHKATRELRELLPNIDVLIEVVDARIPFSSINPTIASLKSDKPTIILMNKSDLADENITQQWLAHYQSNRNVVAIPVSKYQPDIINQLPDQCKKLALKTSERHAHINVLITGIPNVGKSTIINQLVGRPIAKTGNEPAVTKGIQKINCQNGIMLFDTPGILWPKIENENSSYRLAITGAIKNTAFSYQDVAFFAAEFLLNYYPQQLKTRYDLDVLPTTEYELFDILGKKRGCLKKGGIVDIKKITELFLIEVRESVIARLSFETPDMIEKELIETQRRIEEKKAKDEARKNKRK